MRRGRRRKRKEKARRAKGPSRSGRPTGLWLIAVAANVGDGDGRLMQHRGLRMPGLNLVIDQEAHVIAVMREDLLDERLVELGGEGAGVIEPRPDRHGGILPALGVADFARRKRGAHADDAAGAGTRRYAPARRDERRRDEDGGDDVAHRSVMRREVTFLSPVRLFSYRMIIISRQAS